MRRLITLTILIGALAIPGVASGSDNTPVWCGATIQNRCPAAQADFSDALNQRYGAAWSSAKPRLESCPADAAYQGTVQCMAYFSYHGTYRFVDGTVNGSQDRNDSGKVADVTAWHRRWRRCNLKVPAGQPVNRIPGSLESNEPCEAQPMESTYIVGVEMGGWTGHVGFVHKPGWQFAESGYFAQAGMSQVAAFTCAYRRPRITCSDGTGDSFRYTYP
jgi:hypothetical protein